MTSQFLLRLIQNRSAALLVVGLFVFGGVLPLTAQSGASDSKVNLEYESNDFPTSRKVLLQIVARYGQLESLKNQSGTRLEAEFLIPTAQLSSFLAELGSVGHGTSEQVEPSTAAAAERGQSRVSLVLVPRAVVASETAGFPDFQGAFTGLFYFLARIAYVLIWMAPLWILLGLLFWKRRTFIDAFKSAGSQAARVLPSKQNPNSASSNSASSSE